METVLIIDSDADRRAMLRSAVERRGLAVTGEAGSITEVINAVASLDHAPQTVLVGAEVAGAESGRVARLIKRTWPKATVVHELTPDQRRQETVSRTMRVAVAG